MKKCGYYKCIFCGGKLILGGSDMTMDVYPDYDEESIMYYLKCNNCGRDYEIVDPRKEDKEEYSGYWEKKKDG